MPIGGFLPRRFSQMSKDPCWCFFAFTCGMWLGEYPVLWLKFGAKSLIPDPHRYKYHHLLDHTRH